MVWDVRLSRAAVHVIRSARFQRSLGVAKNILSARLSQLVEAGVLSTRPDAGGLHITNTCSRPGVKRCST
jgi:DNA-binding HxlR family transcriptional regulator